MSGRPDETAISSAQKSSHGTPLYSRLVNRKLGAWIAARAFRMGLQPNLITAISATFSFTGIILISTVRPSLVLGLVVSSCLLTGYAFDAADGQLARLRGGGTPSGEWLDHMVDSAKITSLHLAVLVSAYRYMDLPDAALLVPLGFTVVATASFFAMTLNDQLRRQWEIRSGRMIERKRTSLLRSLLVVPTDYGLLCAVFLALGWPSAFFWFYAVLFGASAGFLAVASVKWFGDMKRLT